MFSMGNEFWKYKGGEQIYRKGTHFRKILNWIEGLKKVALPFISAFCVSNKYTE